MIVSMSINGYYTYIFINWITDSRRIDDPVLLNWPISMVPGYREAVGRLPKDPQIPWSTPWN